MVLLEMAARGLSGNLVLAAIVAAGIYVFMNRDTLMPTSSGDAAFAEAACEDAAKSRFSLANVRVYRVSKTNSGYLVAATARLAKGSSAKIECLTNVRGGVEEITLEER